MALSITNSGLAWGMPVRPDLLGQSLEIYAKSYPTLNALRLCHRFGGEDSGISKLPIEILISVERIVVERTRANVTGDEVAACDEKWLDHFSIERSGDWIWSFMHYEGRCEPTDHDHGENTPLYETAEDDVSDQLCDNCKSGETSHCECDNGCDAIVQAKINEYIWESDSEMHHDLCTYQRANWTRMIDQGPKGNFAKYDELLRKHFGLEAFFATSRKGSGKSSAWPEHPNHHWHSYLRELQTTVCYLVLPRQTAHTEKFWPSEMELEDGCASVCGLQSSFITSLRMDDKEKRIKQFQRALRILHLSPFVHASQLNESISPHVADPTIAEASEDDKGQTAKLGKKKKFLKKVKWPQLMMLVKAEYTD